ncbi:MAG: glutathione S-transferase [Oceanococcus sp.]
MITLHHLEQSRSHRFLWLMEELGVKYDIKHYQRDVNTRLAPPELKAIHPLGKSPVITDGDLVIAESGAIIEYLIERYGKGHMMPKPGTDEHLRYRYWLHYGEGTLMPLMVMSLIFGQVEKAPLLVRPIAKAISGQVKKAYLGPNIQANLDFVEAELGKSTWLAGEELTGADIMLSFPLETAGVRSGRDKARPNIQAFVERIHARPAWIRAVERGGPLEFLG